MAELRFDTGVVPFSVNGVENVFSVNPTDANFVEALFTTFDELDKRQREKDADVSNAEAKKAFQIMREYDNDMRRAIDGVLGAGVCDAVFGGMNVYALSGGLPVWANFILAVMDECDTAFAREQKMTNPRLKKYLDKYQKK